MRLPLEDGNNIEDTLLCPACGSAYLHHYKVEVFRRDKEDADKGVHAVVWGSSVIVGNSMKDNPSSRRDGLRILFSCEGCPSISEMTLVQHKGSTLLGMEVVCRVNTDDGVFDDD